MTNCDGVISHPIELDYLPFFHKLDNNANTTKC